jgi:putative NIF3 family GTP cyclohydrolase 1 type 2
MKPDMIRRGVIRSLDWEKNQRGDTATLFEIAPTTLDQLASTVGKRLQSNVVRINGDPRARVRRVAITQGFPGFAANRHALQFQNVDVLVIGEDHEWESIEYAVDAIKAGQLKGLIVLGHIPSEQAGMEEATRWLRTFITDVPVTFIPTRDPFRTK